MTGLIKYTTLALGLSLCGACAAAPDMYDELEDAEEFRGTTGGGGGSGGFSLNTHIAGYTPIPYLPNIERTEGGTTNLGVVVGHDKAQATHVWTVNGELHALDEFHTLHKGDDLTGAEISLLVESEDGVEDVTIYISSVWQDSYGVWRYIFRDITLLEDGDDPDEATPTCVAEQGGDISAVLYEDVIVNFETAAMELVGEQRLTLIGCTTGALGKVGLEALGWGYRPYDPEVGLAHFQTAVRAARADYCGDGKSWTEDGTELGVGDNLGVRPLPPGELEVLWDSYGAICWRGDNLRQVDVAEVACSNEYEVPECPTDGALKGLYNTSPLITTAR